MKYLQLFRACTLDIMTFTKINTCIFNLNELQSTREFKKKLRLYSYINQVLQIGLFSLSENLSGVRMIIGKKFTNIYNKLCLPVSDSRDTLPSSQMHLKGEIFKFVAHQTI